MNDDIFEANWKQVQGQVKEWWGRLSDDEILQVQGRFDRLAALLQERYGYSRAAAEDEIGAFLEQARIEPGRS